jgi:putative DNA primase/helicase
MGKVKELDLASLDWSNIFPHYIDSQFLSGKGRWWRCPLCDGEETFGSSRLNETPTAVGIAPAA